MGSASRIGDLQIICNLSNSYYNYPVNNKYIIHIRMNMFCDYYYKLFTEEKKYMSFYILFVLQNEPNWKISH